MKENILIEKSKKFAIDIINLCDEIKGSASIINKLLRSGTSIGANVRESNHAQSAPDFLSKMQIALKEADETQYWLELLLGGEYISEAEYKSMNEDCEQLLKLLTSIIKTTQANLEAKDNP